MVFKIGKRLSDYLKTKIQNITVKKGGDGRFVGGVSKWGQCHF